MRWPIPDIPEKKAVTPPNYKFWISILVVTLLAGAMLAIFVAKVTSNFQVFLYGIVPAILIWLCFFGLVFYRYEQSVNTVILWNEETERTKLLWQRWSRKQQVVLANVVLTPEESNIRALLGDSADIPAYPKKARPLFADFPNLDKRLAFIKQQIENQYPGYRFHLNKIAIQYQKKYQEDIVANATYKQWDLYPEFIHVSDLFCANDVKQDSGLVLLLCLQDWVNDQAENFSEFITAQLIASNDFIYQKTLPVIAGVGRRLLSDSLVEGLDILFEYNRLEKTSIRHIWLSGIGSNDRTCLIQYAASKEWQLPERCPVISLDHSFGPPGPLMFPVAISLLSDAAQDTDAMQLLISKNEENVFSLCLLTRELFS